MTKPPNNVGVVESNLQQYIVSCVIKDGNVPFNTIE